MLESNNPYQPPAEALVESDHTAAEGLSSDRIDISGVVTLDDFAKLVSMPIKYLIRGTAIVLVGLIVSGMLYMMTIAPPQNHIRMGVVTFVAVFVVGGIFWFLDWWARRSRHATRFLGDADGLLGPISGHLDAFGFTFRDEASQQYRQYSWAAFPKVAVTEAGVRLDFKLANGVFIAIPAVCIRGFERREMQSIVDGFRSSASQAALFQALPDWSLTPADAIRFHNEMLLKPPPSRWLVVLYRCVVSLVWVMNVAIVASIISHEIYGASLYWLVTTCLVAGLCLVGQLSLGQRVLPTRFKIGQWGWLTSEGVQAHQPGLHVNFRWTDASDLEVTESMVIARFADGSAFLVAKDHFLNSDGGEQWKQLLSWIDT